MSLRIIYTILYFIIPSFVINCQSREKDTLNFNEIAKAYYYKGEFHEAERYFEKALQHCKDSFCIATNLNDLGVIYKNQDKYNLALQTYDKAEKYTNDQDMLVKIFSNKAVVYKNIGEYETAILYYDKALKKTANEKLRASILNNVSNVYYLKEDYEKALTNYEKALKIKSKYDPGSIPYTTLNIALCHMKLGSDDLADQYYKQTIKERITQFGKDHYRLITAYLNYANFQNSIHYFNEAYRLSLENYGEKHPETSRCLMSIGDYHFSKKEFKEALIYYQKSLSANDKSFSNNNFYQNPDISNALSKLVLLEVLGKKAKAFQMYSQTFPDPHKGLIMSLQTYGLAMDLIFELQNSFTFDESKRALLSNQKDIFHEATLVALALNDTEKAFQITEKGKASVLLSTLNNRYAMRYGNIPDTLIEKENELKRLLQVGHEPITYQKSYDSLIHYFENNYPEYYNLKYNVKDVDVGNLLRDDQVLIEYSLSDTLLLTFLYDGQCSVHGQKISADFYSSLLEFISTLKNYNLAENYDEQYHIYVSKAYELYEVLLKPISDRIQGKSLVIIPDGVLAYLPFEALLTEKTNEKHYFSLPYLVYDHPVSYSYAARYLDKSFAGNPQKKLLAVAPIYNTRYASLRNEEEVQSIRFKGDVLKKNEATKERFLKDASNYEIIHLATHGVLDLDNSLNSYLVFSDDSLTASEIYGMNLNAKLSVLTACNTGDGELTSEGVMSMSRAFAYAGCPSVVMSLWTHKDHMSDLTSDFYKYLKRGQPVDKALQKAKIDHLKKEKDAAPHYWANLVVNGKTEPVNKNLKYYYWILIALIWFAGLYFYRRWRY